MRHNPLTSACLAAGLALLTGCSAASTGGTTGSGGATLTYLTFETPSLTAKFWDTSITDTEKQLVRDHLDEINERLADQGLRVISLSDPEHVERYGLQDLARDRNLELEFGLADEADIEDQVDAKVA